MRRKKNLLSINQRTRCRLLLLFTFEGDLISNDRSKKKRLTSIQSISRSKISQYSYPPIIYRFVWFHPSARKDRKEDPEADRERNPTDGWKEIRAYPSPCRRPSFPYLVWGIPYLMPTPTRGSALITFFTVAWSGNANRIEAAGKKALKCGL